jgi:LmbE family N-acetylglucosaminyl deacetylase
VNILAISAHTDDYEFACGGAISRWIREGAKIYGVSFSCGSADKKEFYEANKILGVQDTELHELPTREFKEYRQTVLEHLVRLERQVSPNLVLIPATTDTHQDHEVIREEGFRAFKHRSILGYEMPQNNLVFQTNCFVELQSVDVDRKIKALSSYVSQRNRPYASEEFIRSLALVRGMQAGKKYAEAYEMIRWMV